MKKLFLALLIALMCFGVALADGPEAAVTVVNATPVDGVYSGDYYYKLYFAGDEVQWTFSRAIDADAPTAEDEIAIDHPDIPDEWWRRDAGGAFMITTAPQGMTENPADALFYRAGSSGDWQKIVFHYDLSKGDEDGNHAYITNTDFPTELMEDYTVTWQPQQNADLYYLRWLVPNGHGYAFWFSGEESSYTLSTERDRWENWGGPENLTGFVGDYEFWVTALVDGEYRNSVHKTFTIAAPGAGEVRVESGRQDENGAVAMRLNEWIDLQIHADPNNLEDLVVVCGDRYEHVVWDEDGSASFTWTADIDGYEEYTYNAYVRARYAGQDEWVYSNVIPITVEMKDQIEGDLTWTVNGSTTVARDGMFIIDVNNIGADFYNMYVAEESGEWIADSHWVWAEEGDTTTVRMPLVNLTPGEYDVHVFAVKYGAANLDAGDTIHITVTDPVSDNPLLISMRESYVTGDFLRIAASYTTPGDQDYRLEVLLRDNETGYWYQRWESWSEPFWDEGYKLWSSGSFTLQAQAWSNVEGEDPILLASAEFPFRVTAERDITVTLPAMPDTLNVGQGLSFTVQKPTGADEYTVEVWIDLPDDNGRDVFLREGITDDTCTVSVSADDLADALSSVYVAVEGVGYNAESDFKYKAIPYYHATDSRAQLTVTGLDENNTTLVNKNFKVRVAPTGDTPVQAIRLYADNGLWNEEGMDEDGTWTRDVSLNGNDIGYSEHSVFAMVTFDSWREEWNGLDYDPRTWVYTNTVRVGVQAEGSIDGAHFSLSKNEAVRGEYIEVPYAAAEHAEHYWLDMERYNDEWDGWEWWNSSANLSTQAGQGGTAQIATANMPAGTYHVRVACTGPGYIGYWGDWTEELTITEPTGEHSTVQLFVQPTIIRTGDRMYVSAYANDADWIDVLWNAENDGGWTDSWGGSSFADERQPYWSDGVYQIRAVAWYPMDEPDEDGNDHYPVYSDPITVTVSAPDGRVDLVKPDLPVTLREGEDLRVQFPLPEGGEWVNLHLEIQNRWDRWYVDNWHFDREDVDLTLDGEWLRQCGALAEGCVVLRADGGAVGKNVNGWEAVIPIVEASAGDAVQATIAFDGMDGNTAQVMVHQDIGLTVLMNQNRVPVHKEYELSDGTILTVEESDRMERVLIYDGFNYRQDDQEPNKDGLTCSANITFQDPGTYHVLARVTFTPWNSEWDDLNLDFDPRIWYSTDVVTVHVDSLGQVGAPTFTLDKNTVARGEDITITYGGGQDADEYWIDIDSFNPESNRWDNLYGGMAHLDAEPGQGGVVTLSTVLLKPGQYRLRAACWADGYQGYWMNFEEGQKLTVTEPNWQAGEENHLRVSIAPTDIASGDFIHVSVLAPGANWIDAYWNYKDNLDWNSHWDGDSVDDDQTPYWSTGSYEAVIAAWYPDYDENGQPVMDVDDEGNEYHVHSAVYSDPITISVTTQDTISVPAINPALPVTLSEGEGLHFSITATEDFAFLNVNVSFKHPYGGEEWPGDEAFSAHANTGETASVSLDWQTLQSAGIQVGDTLVVHVNGGAWGYQVNDLHVNIPLINVPQQPQAVLAFAPGSSTLVNEDIGLTVTAAADGQGNIPAIQAVRFFDGYSYREDDYSIGEDGVYRTNAGYGHVDTTLRLYALVTFDPWNSEWDGQNTDPRTWVCTNVLTLDLTSNGQVGPFGITDITPAVATRGDRIRVTLSGSVGAEDYWLNFRDFGHDWHWADRENRVMEFSTADLAPGDYSLSVGASARGMENYDTPWVSFHVNERTDMPQNGVQLLLSTTELALNEGMDMTVYAPGALRVGIIVDNFSWHMDPEGNYVWGDGSTWHEENRIVWSNRFDVGQHTVTGCAQFEEGGEWVYTTEQTVNVYSLGSLALDLSQLPAYVVKENDQTTTELNIPLPEHAQYMTVHVKRMWDGGEMDLFHRDDIPEELELVITPDNLVPGEQIQVYIDAYGEGYASTDGGVSIPVLEATAGSGASVILETGNAGNQLIEAPVKVLVRPDAGRQIQALRFYDGRGFWENGQEITHDNHGDWFEEDGSFFAWFSYMREDLGQHAVYAYVLMEGETEWFRTNVLTVCVTSLGDVGSFDFVPGTAHEITVTRGDSVTFQFTEAEHANHYWLDAFDTAEWRSWDPWRFEDGTTVIMKTAGLPAGDYEIYGRAGGDEGWRWNESFSHVVMHLVDAEAGTVRVSVDRTDLLTQETTDWSVYAPGAVSIEVRGWPEDDENNLFFFRMEDGDAMTGRVNFDHACTACIQATATYADGSIRTSGLSTINVTAPYGDLGGFTVSGNLYYEGGTVEFTIVPDEHTEWFKVYDLFDATNGYGELYYRTPDDQVERGGKSFRWDNFTAHLGIHVYQAAEGYNSSDTMMFYRPINNSNTLNLPAFLRSIEEEAFQGNRAATHVIIPDGVTAIGARAFADCGFCTVEIPASVTSIGEGAFVEGNVTIYGYGGSAAERYAAAHDGIEFVQID